MPVYNIKGLKESDGVVFKTIPAGAYPARIVNIEEKKSKETSKHPNAPYLNVTLQITEGDYDGSKQFLMINLPYEELDAMQIQRAIDSLKHICMVTGVQVDDNFDTQSLLGGTCVIVVTEETYEGKKVNRIKDTLPLQ